MYGCLLDEAWPRRRSESSAQDAYQWALRCGCGQGVGCGAASANSKQQEKKTLQVSISDNTDTTHDEARADRS